MNYIKHLTGFFNKSNQDEAISPTHISLYLALFQRWNLNRFKNPIIISREEMMLASKIKSKATYHKCMKELHMRNYIIYKPSYNPYAGTEVILTDLSISSTSSTKTTTSPNFERTQSLNELIPPSTSLKFERTVSKNGQHNEQVYIDNNKTLENSNKTIYPQEEKKEIKKEKKIECF